VDAVKHSVAGAKDLSGNAGCSIRRDGGQAWLCWNCGGGTGRSLVSPLGMGELRSSCRVMNWAKYADALMSQGFLGWRRASQLPEPSHSSPVM
jgi:hypothetical protein